MIEPELQAEIEQAAFMASEVLSYSRPDIPPKCIGCVVTRDLAGVSVDISEHVQSFERPSRGHAISRGQNIAARSWLSIQGACDGYAEDECGLLRPEAAVETGTDKADSLLVTQARLFEYIRHQEPRLRVRNPGHPLPFDIATAYTGVELVDSLVDEGDFVIDLEGVENPPFNRTKMHFAGGRNHLKGMVLLRQEREKFLQDHLLIYTGENTFAGTSLLHHINTAMEANSNSKTFKRQLEDALRGVRAAYFGPDDEQSGLQVNDLRIEDGYIEVQYRASVDGDDDWHVIAPKDHPKHVPGVSHSFKFKTGNEKVWEKQAVINPYII